MVNHQLSIYMPKLNENRIRKISQQQEVLSMALQGYNRQSISEILGISKESIRDALSVVTSEMDLELNDLRKTFLASAMNRMEDLVQRQVNLLDQMEFASDKEAAENRFSIRDYISVTKTISGLIKQQHDMLNTGGRLPDDMVDGVANRKSDEPPSISEDDPIYQALLSEYADSENPGSLLDPEEDSPEETDDIQG
jgi:hypothetical protein